MPETITLMQLVFGVYVPFVIALVGLSVPMVAILLSVFAQGRDEINRTHLEELNKITEDIKANEVSKQHWMVELFWKLVRTRFRLLLLNPNYYLFLLLAPPVVSVIFSVLSLQSNTVLFLFLSCIFLFAFLLTLWSLIILIAEITAKRDAKKEERERVSVELLQEILKYSKPDISLVRNCSLLVNGEKVNNNDVLPQTVLGKESSWQVSFANSENTNPAKRVEVGIQFPTEIFEIKIQSGYSLFAPENIVRFESEYVAKHTTLNFTSSLLVFTPKRTGEYEVKAWLKGENVESIYFALKIKVESEV